MIRWAVAALVFLGSAEIRAEEITAHCDAAEALAEPAAALSRSATDWVEGLRLRVVVLGSSSSLGWRGGLAYPGLLAEDLRRRLGDTVDVVDISRKRHLAALQVAHIERQLLTGPLPSLVVWETGTTDVVKGADATELAQVVANGIQRLRARGIDVVLVDPQYSPQTASVFNFAPVVEALARVAEAENVPVLPRYEIMRYLAGMGSFQPRQAEHAAPLHACLSHLLAEMIVKGMRSAAP